MEFMQWISHHNRSYGTVEEYAFRFQEFVRNNVEILKLRQELTTSTVGHNEFSDWTEAEFNKLMGFKGYDSQKERVYKSIHG
jgi:hypothetical protein